MLLSSQGINYAMAKGWAKTKCNGRWVADRLGHLLAQETQADRSRSRLQWSQTVVTGSLSERWYCCLF